MDRIIHKSKCICMVHGDPGMSVLLGESLSSVFSLSSWWLGEHLP